MRRFLGMLALFFVAFLGSGPTAQAAPAPDSTPEAVPLSIAPVSMYERTDACSTADISFKWYLITARQYDCSDLNCSEVGTFKLVDDSWNTVAHLTLQIYSSTSDEGSFVTSRDTFTIPGDGGPFTVFGRSANTQEGMTGARGLIIGAIDGRGRPVEMKGTYLFSRWNDTPKICFWLE